MSRKDWFAPRRTKAAAVEVIVYEGMTASTFVSIRPALIGGAGVLIRSRWSLKDRNGALG